MATDQNCIFCKIIGGDIPSHKIYEDDRVYAFLDIGPLSRGHTLIVPKDHYVTLDQMPDEVAAACGLAAKRIGTAVQHTTGCVGWNVLQNNGEVAGQVVMHVHFHIIPRATDDALGFRWPAGKLDADDAAQLKQGIIAALGEMN